MTRHTRRRLGVALTAALIGMASPLWGPRVLRTVPAFRVATIEVTGRRFVTEDEAVALAAISPHASVWDDHRAAADRLRAHPLVQEVEIRRSGHDGLQIRLREVRAVALVPTPTLSVVDARGDVLPVDPARHGIDLPILQGARIEAGRVADEDSRRVLAALGRLGELSQDFVDRISEVRRVPEDAVELLLLDGSHADRIVLPVENADVAFLRVEDALRRCEGQGRIESADARFRGQVVIDLEGEA